MNLKPIAILITILMCASQGYTQEAGTNNVQVYTLEEIIKLALNKSLASLQASTIKENRYWQWRTYKSNYRPQLSLSGALPGYNRTFQDVRQNDGTVAFVPVSYNYSSLDLSLSQYIGLTGGQIFVSSQIERFENTLTDAQNQTRFNSKPTYIGIKQPLFTHNELWWDRKIEPLRYEESQKKYNEDMETIVLQVTGLFFELLNSQKTLEITKNNLASNDTIYKIGEVKFNMGKISESELMQLKLNQINTRKMMAQSQLALEIAALNLKAYTGFSEEDNITLALPDNIPFFDVNEEIALSEALKKRSNTTSFKRRILEAEKDVAEAKANSGFNASLIATVGISSKGTGLSNVYNDPVNQQSVNLGFQVPILDWGRAASKIKTAKANKKLVEYSVAQEEINFKNQIKTQVRQFSMNREQVKTNNEANEIARRRFMISKNRYLVGDLGITDLTIALQEKDQAQREYLFSLKNFWTSYHYLELLTLYDFGNHKPIDHIKSN